MSKKLNIRINWKEFLKEPGKKEELHKYCSRFDVCPSDKDEKTYVLWPSLFSDFSLINTFGWDSYDKDFKWDNDNLCMAYFM